MQSKSLHFYSNWFLGFDAWKSARGPYYVWPAIVWVSLEDLNLNVKGASLTLMFLNFYLQLQLKKWDKAFDDRKYIINDKEMELLLDELKGKHGWRIDPDAAKIREIVSKNNWMRQIFSSVGVRNAYALGVLSAILHQEKSADVSNKNEINFDLIGSK